MSMTEHGEESLEWKEEVTQGGSGGSATHINMA